MSSNRLQKGQIEKRGSWWRLRWWEKTAEGQRVRRSSILGPAIGLEAITKSEAAKRAWEQLKHVNASIQCTSSQMSIRQFVAQRFEPEYVFTLKPAGKKHYRYCFKKILPMLGDVRLTALDCATVQQFLTSIIKRDGLSVQTATHLKNALSAVYRYAKGLKYYTGDLPTEGIRLPELIPAERDAFTWEEIEKLLPLIPEPVQTMVVMSCTLSLNVAELTGLQWQDINLSDETVATGGVTLPSRSIIVRRNWYLAEYSSVKTKNRKRIQPLSDNLVARLKTIRESSKWTQAEDPVFASRTGRPVDAHNVTKRLFRAKLTKVLGKPVGWHLFRHTCATFVDYVQMPKADRIALMGHGGAAMTDRYTHSDIERRRAYIEQIAGRLHDRPTGERRDHPAARDMGGGTGRSGGPQEGSGRAHSAGEGSPVGIEGVLSHGNGTELLRRGTTENPGGPGETVGQMAGAATAGRGNDTAPAQEKEVSSEDPWEWLIGSIQDPQGTRGQGK